MQVAVQLESGDDHWQRSLEASAKAREQAAIVERESQVSLCTSEFMFTWCTGLTKFMERRYT